MNRLLTFIAACAIASVSASAQTDVRFVIAPVENPEIAQSECEVIDTRLREAFNRSQAVSGNPSSVFTIIPTVTLEEAAESEGLVREVARIKASLTLTAVNTVDATEYHSVTVPLKANATGGKEAAMKSLARSIRPTDPVYVRFIRTARERIADYYAANCATLLKKAQVLTDSGQYGEAMSILSAVPENLSCYDQAADMIVQIAPYIRSEVPDTVVIERVVEVPVEKIVEVPAEPEPVVEPEPVETPVKPEKPSVPECKITVDSDMITVKILSCTGNPGTGRITIKTEIVNLDHRKDNYYATFRKAFSSDGVKLDELMQQGTKYSTGYLSLPDRIPVKFELQIGNTTEAIDMLSFLEFSLDNIKVTVRDLQVKW